MRHTARLLLRPPGPADLEFLVALFARIELVANRPDPRPDSPETSAARLARDMAHWQKHGYGRWAVEVQGQLIGFGGLKAPDPGEDPSISYHLHPASWGQGYATELVGSAVAFAFNGLVAARVVGLVRPVNVASRRVLEKCGFRLVGRTMLHDAPIDRFAIERDPA